MALDLTLKINADASQAKAELAKVEQGITRVELAARKGEPSIASVAKELGVYDNVTNRVVTSTAKLEQTTKNLSTATADQLYQQVRASLGMADMERRVEALDASYKAAAASSAGFSTAVLAGGVAIAAFLAVGALELKFLYDSAKLYAERSGLMDQFNAQVDRVKEHWQNMQVAVGALLLSNVHDVQSWGDVAVRALDFVGGYIIRFVANAMASFELLGVAWQKAISFIPGVGMAPPTAPSAPSLFSGSKMPPIAAPDFGAVVTDLNAQRYRLDHPAKADKSYSIPPIPYQLGYTGQVPGWQAGPLGAPVDIPTIPYHLGYTGEVPGFKGTVSNPLAGYNGGFMEQVFGGNFGGNLGNVLLSAITGGGSLLKGAGSLVGSSLGSVLGKTLTSGAGIAIGGIGGGVLNAVLPGVGALLGPAISGLFGKLFGETQGHKDLMAANGQISGIQSDLLKQFGSKENIGLLGGGDVLAGWGSQNVKGLEAFSGAVDAFKAKSVSAMNEMVHNAMTAGTAIPASMQPILESLIRQGQLTEANANLLLGLPEKGVPSFQAISEAAKELGVNVESLGTKVQNVKLGEQADAAAHSFEVLRDAGADMGQVFAQSAPKMQEFVDRALKMGLALPESIKPWLQQMVDAGLLVDETGTKLTDLSRFDFTKPLEKSVEDLIAKLDELIAKLGGGVVDAVKKIPRNVDIDVNAHVKDVDGDYTNPDGAWTGGVVRPWGIQKFGRGGRVRGYGTDTVPAMLTPGELVLNAAQQKHVAGAIRGSGPQVTVNFHHPVLANDETQLAQLAELINRATISELTRRGISLSRN